MDGAGLEEALARARTDAAQGERRVAALTSEVEGLREAVNAFKSEVQDVDAKTVMDLMIVTQYFDMMKDIGADSKSNAVFMTHSPAGLASVSEALSSGILSNVGMKR